jgi:hypothetical protein
MGFVENLGTIKPAEKEIALVWLGQAGFLIRQNLLFGGYGIQQEPSCLRNNKQAGCCAASD